MVSNSSRDYTINAVKRALEILKLFKENSKGLSISEIAERSGMNRSSALRYAYTLADEGFLMFDELTQKYSLGIELYKLGIIKYDSLDWRSFAVKKLHELADKVNMICYIAVREGDEIIMLDQILPSNVPSWAQLMTIIGNSEPLYSTGIGRLFLANDSDTSVEQYLSKVDTFVKITDSTIVDKDELWREIRSARKLGYNVNRAENEDIFYGIGAPIFDRKGKMIAGISLCGIDQIVKLQYNEYVILIKRVAAEISYQLGYED